MENCFFKLIYLNLQYFDILQIVDNSSLCSLWDEPLSLIVMAI